MVLDTDLPLNAIGIDGHEFFPAKKRKWPGRRARSNQKLVVGHNDIMLATEAKHLWKMGHSRWQTENNIFNTLGQHWSLNHCYKHDPVAIVNFVLMLFIVFSLVQCFYTRNLKPPIRKIINSLISLTNQLYVSLSMGVSEPATRPSTARPP